MTRRARRSLRRPARLGAVAPWAALLGLFALVMTGALGLPLQGQDEVSLLLYPSLAADGHVAHRDFMTFYGPGNTWLLAGVYEAFGLGVVQERLAGLAMRLLVIAALVALAHALGGPRAARAAFAVAAIFMGGLALQALASIAALGLLLAAVVAATPPPRTRLRRSRLVTAGALAAAPLLWRYDAVVPVAATAGALLWACPSLRSRWTAVGAAVVLAPLGLHLAAVGPDALERTMDLLRASAPGRSVPFGRGGWFSAPTAVLAALATGALGLAAVRARREGDGRATAILAATAAASAGLVPYALGRLDMTHLATTAVVPLALAPAALARLRPDAARARRAAIVVPAVVVLLFSGEGVRRMARYAANVATGQSFQTVEVARQGRAVPLEPGRAADVSAVAAFLDRHSRPGQRLFLGPSDMRFAFYSSPELYLLFPDLPAATYYLELTPRTANAPGSGLAREVASADWVVLDGTYAGRSEPNASRIAGPSEPNAIVRTRFCLRTTAGRLSVFRRCR